MDLLNGFLLNDKKRVIASVLILAATAYTLSTYIISLSAFVSPSQQLRWDVDLTYINSPAFTPGQTVTVEGVLIEGDTYFERGVYYFFTAPEDIVWFVNVVDPNHMPVEFTDDTISTALGDQIIGQLSFTLPNDAVTGTYTLKLVVWSGWLPDGETRTDLIGELTFEVVAP